jgi:hypothetical protein
MKPYNGSGFDKITAIVLFVLLTGLQEARCQESILDSIFTFREGGVKTGNALNIITRKTGYNFTYDTRLVRTDNRVEMTFTGQKLNVILDSILKNDSLVYSVIDRYIIISRVLSPPVQKIDSLLYGEHIQISGIVTDAETNTPLPYATVALKNKGKGTVTNNNGEFVLNLTHEFLADTLSLSYLGFIKREIPVTRTRGSRLTIAMKREFISIPEIIIRTRIPQEILYKTLDAIPGNYGDSPAMLTGFYREGVMKKQELQTYSEAILEIYKSAYSGSLLNDQIKVFKSRKMENLGIHDTLALRLKAGLSTCLELDVAKNTFDFLSKQSMPEYVYRITDIVSFDGATAFVIDFEQREGIEMPLYKGTVYINADDFAVLQADFELHPKYISKMRESFISSSSHGFNTWPLTVKYSVSYRKDGKRYFLNHVRGDLVFTSKQSKRLFSSQFKVFFELAITGINTRRVNRFEREELAPVYSVFSKTITQYDPDFWGDQDFLKPEDNLLEVLKNMKVKLQEFPREKN